MHNFATLWLAIVFLICSCTAESPDGFVVKGTINGLDSDTVTLQYSQYDSMSVDTVQADDGQFAFRGAVSYPSKATIQVGNRNQLTFYIENSEISVKGNIDSLNKAKVSGSKPVEQYEKYKQQLATLDKQFQQVIRKQKEVREEGNSEILERLKVKAGSLHTEKVQQKKRFLKNYPDSFISLQNMKSIMYSYSYDDIAPLYKSIPKELKSTAMGKEISKLIKAKKRTRIGSIASGFTLESLSGDSISLRSYRGKYVLVDFWASWCKPCREEHPNYVDAYEKYSNQNFTILSVSIDENREDWEQAVKKDGLTWTQVSSLQGIKGKAAIKYGIRAIPINFLLDPNGKIVAKNLRGKELHKKLEEILM